MYLGEIDFGTKVFHCFYSCGTYDRMKNEKYENEKSIYGSPFYNFVRFVQLTKYVLQNYRQ